MTSSFESKGYREGFAGGCYQNGNPICVAVPEDHCDAGTWKTAFWLRSNPGDPLRYCAGSLEEALIGRCGSSGPCRNVAERCDDPTTFVYPDSTCTVTHDLTLFTPVTYGRCGTRCVWSSNDCIVGGETYTPNDPLCTADKVQIGACWAGHAWCAVAAEACNGEVFYTHQETIDNVDVNCYLSRLPDLTPTMSPVPPPPTLPPVTTTNTPPQPVNVPNNVRSNSNNNNNNGDGLSTGAVVGILAGVAVVVGIAMGAFGFHHGRRSRLQAIKSNKRDPKLPESLDISHNYDTSHDNNSGMPVDDEDLSLG